jgi:hypothetical protein
MIHACKKRAPGTCDAAETIEAAGAVFAAFVDNIAAGAGSRSAHDAASQRQSPPSPNLLPRGRHLMPPIA